MPRYYSVPADQAADGNWTTNLADQPQEDSTPSSFSQYPPPPIGLHHQPTGMDQRLDPGSGGGPTYHPGEAQYPQAHVHLASTGGLHPSTEASQFTLLRSPYNPDSRAKLIYEQPAESERIGVDKQEIALEFHSQLKSFAGCLKQCKKRHEWSDNPPEQRQLLRTFIDQGERVNTNVRELIIAMDGTMRAVHFHDDGTPTQEVWNAFMRNFLRDDNQLQTTKDLTRHMDQWVCYYEADCTFAPKTFTFLGQDHGVYCLRSDLLNCADMIFGPQSPTTRPVRDFTRNLSQVADGARQIKNHESLLEIEEVSRSVPRARRICKGLINKQEMFYDRIRDLVAECEAYVRAPWRYKGGSLTYDASLSFMEALLGPNKLFRELDHLRWDMVEWLEHFDEDCAPILKNIQDTAQRIIDEDDRRRRIEEQEQREEQARRREGHRHSKKRR